jgi:tol-pal system protein YbgF
MSATILDRVDNQDRRFEKVMQALKRVTSEVNNIRGASGQARGSKGKTLSQKPLKKLSTAPASGSGSTNSDTEQRMIRQQALSQYEEVMAVFKQGNLDRARQGFTEFLMMYPASSRAASAQYWLAECFYGSQQYEKAIGAYQRVEQQYPNSEKVPASLLKQGFAYLALDNRSKARSNLERVVQLYPATPEAGKASERLRQLQARP